MTNICRRVLITLGMICAMLGGLWLLAGCGLDGKTDDNAGKDQAVSENQTTAKTEDQTAEETDNQQEATSEYTSQSEEDNKTMIYVALGDSLTKGYGLADAEKNRFSAVAAKKLNAAGIKCTERNYGVNGLTSSELLDMINGGEIGMLDYADVITVDIGANDVLHAADDLIYTNLAGNTLSEDDYAAVCADEEQSLAQCKENTEAIIKALREKNDHAQIIMFTIYNPYRNVNLDLAVEGENLTLSGFTDDLVKRLNENIKDIAEAQGCEVGDWYTAFEINPNNLVNASYGEGVTTNFDIHPNKDGHAVMGEVCYQAIKKG